MTMPPQCDEVRQQLSLLLYGELSFDEEEKVQAHIGACEDCREALVAERVLHEMLDRHEGPSADSLALNRARLAAALQQEAAPGGSFWTRLRAAVALVAPARIWRPVAAMALVVLGFLSGQWYAERGSLAAARIAGEPVSSRVRQVDVDGKGMLQLVVDETRQRVISLYAFIVIPLAGVARYCQELCMAI